MVLGLEIGMLIWGIMALATGRLTLSKTRVVEGPAARLAGGIMVLPLPLALGVGFVMGFNSGMRGKPLNINEFRATLMFMELAIVLVCLVVAMVIGFVASQPPSPTRSAEPFSADALFAHSRSRTPEAAEDTPWAQPVEGSEPQPAGSGPAAFNPPSKPL